MFQLPPEVCAWLQRAHLALASHLAQCVRAFRLKVAAIRLSFVEAFHTEWWRVASNVSGSVALTVASGELNAGHNEVSE